MSSIAWSLWEQQLSVCGPDWIMFYTILTQTLYPVTATTQQILYRKGRSGWNPFILCILSKHHTACKAECALWSRWLCTLKWEWLQSKHFTNLCIYPLCAHIWEVKLHPSIYPMVPGDSRMNSCFQSWWRLFSDDIEKMVLSARILGSPAYWPKILFFRSLILSLGIKVSPHFTSRVFPRLLVEDKRAR